MRGDGDDGQRQDGAGERELVLLGEVGVLVDVEDHVDVAAAQGLEQLLRRAIGLELEVEPLVLKTALCSGDVVGDHAGELAGIAVEFADAGVKVQKAHLDRPVLGKPLLLVARGGGDKLCGEVLLVELVGIEGVVALQREQSAVELGLELRAAFADADVDVGAADGGEGGQADVRPARGLHGEDAIDLVVLGEGLCLLAAREVDVLGLYAF